MRPIRSFLLLLIFLICFTGLHYLIPATQLFPSIYDFLPDTLVNSLYSGDKKQNIPPVEKVTNKVRLTHADTISRVNTFRSTPETIALQPIRRFLDSLNNSRGQLRIMYYGDSQIEGDRISSYLRQALRKGHGGTGPGLFLPLMPVMFTKSISILSSSNWKRYNYLSYKTGEIKHRDLGPFMTICRYLPDDEKAPVPVTAFIRIRPSSVADITSSQYDFLRVFYGNTKEVVSIIVKANDKLIFSETLKRGKGFYEIGCPLNKAKDVTIEFTGRVSPDIYGISIESKNGVIVDNIPQRGSAGLEFTMVNKENLARSLKKLSPDLFILQYGLNIVKNVRNDYSYYRKGLLRQLSLLKEISPNTGILLISLTDMAVNESNIIKSYGNIPVIIEAQKQAAREARVAFWNSYTAMGGQSSIVRWAEKEPPLAQKDYVHFTYPGADTLSKMLLNSLLSVRGVETDRNKHDIKKDVIITANPAKAAELSTDQGVKSLRETLISSIFKYNPDEPFIFSSPAFWIFFLLVLAGYSLIYKKQFIRNTYLFLVSLFFYYKTGGLFLFLLIFVTLIDFTCGLLIYNSRTRLMRRFFILLSITSNLGILAYFKYTGFFINVINDLFGTDFRVYDFLAAFSNSHLGTSFNISNILLPVGISFFTFQSLSYTIDVYRRKMEPVRNVIDFGFYVSFFPQLVAGPIVRASEFIPQLYSDFHLAKREFSHALFLISKGLIKKIIISDFIAINFIDRVFDAPSTYSGFENLMAVYGYGLQIYCDFSGYTDIAIGLALILGFRLPVNFNSPYKGSSVTDFWKRWHISLSRWLKDYLYIPLGGNRKGKIRANLNLIITMLLGGLWHGADLKFIVWSFLHGMGLVANRIVGYIFGDRLKHSKISRAISIFFTFQFVSFCWIFFRAPDMDSAKLMFNQIFENFSPGSYLTVIVVYSSVFLLIGVGYVIHFLPEKIKEAYRGLFIRFPVILQLVILMLIAILLYNMRTTAIMPFIYFRF